MGDFFTQIQDWLDFGWDIGNWALNVRKILLSVLLIVFGFIFIKFILRWILQLLESKKTLLEKDKRKVKRNFLAISLASILIGLLKILDLDYVLYETNENFGAVKLRVSFILLAAIIILLARLFDWFISGAIGRYYDKRDEIGDRSSYTPAKQQKDARGSANQTIQYVVYLVTAIIILRTFNINYELFTTQGGGHFTVSSIIEAILCLFIARLLIWVATNIIFHSYYKKSNVDVGSQYAVNQIFSYIIYVLAVILALKSLQFDLNLLLTGAAALLVGIGLGLQNLFSDLVSGIILLFEGTIEIGDVVEVDGIVGTVVKIGIRTSLIQIRDNKTIIVPNTKFVAENVNNWSHGDSKARFHIDVGVAYGSDTELVRELLLQVAEENQDVLNSPKPFVRFTDFGDSSLNMQLQFWTRNFIQIEDVKSDLRFSVDAIFRNNNVEIPFPQRDIWVRNNNPKNPIQ